MEEKQNMYIVECHLFFSRSKALENYLTQKDGKIKSIVIFDKLPEVTLFDLVHLNCKLKVGILDKLNLH